MASPHFKIIKSKNIPEEDIEDFFESFVSPFGSGSKISCPSKFNGKKVIVVVLK